jgi:hypothetical protein
MRHKELSSVVGPLPNINVADLLTASSARQLCPTEKLDTLGGLSLDRALQSGTGADPVTFRWQLSKLKIAR